MRFLLSEGKLLVLERLSSFAVILKLLLGCCTLVFETCSKRGQGLEPLIPLLDFLDLEALQVCGWIFWVELDAVEERLNATGSTLGNF